MCSWFCFSSFNMDVDKWGTYKYILINRWQLYVTCEVLEYTTWFWENLKLLNLWQQLSSFSLKLLLPSTVCLTVFFFFHSATSIPSTFSSSSSSDSCDHSIPSMCSKSTSSWTASTSKEKKYDHHLTDVFIPLQSTFVLSNTQKISNINLNQQSSNIFLKAQMVLNITNIIVFPFF